jgi:hypothetical protein
MMVTVIENALNIVIHDKGESATRPVAQAFFYVFAHATTGQQEEAARKKLAEQNFFIKYSLHP